MLHFTLQAAAQACRQHSGGWGVAVGYLHVMGLFVLLLLVYCCVSHPQTTG